MISDRTINRWCVDADGELVIGNHPIGDLVRTCGSPLYVYDEVVLQDQLELMRTIYPGFQIYYSMKANPDPRVVSYLAKKCDGVEIASSGELTKAMTAGCEASRVVFAGPGKTQEELGCGFDAGIQEFHVESIGEATRLNDLARAFDRVVDICIRVNPSGLQVGAMRMGGRSTQFGIDEEKVDTSIEVIESLANLRLRGTHLFCGTQILDADLLLNLYERCVDISLRVAMQVGRPIETIDFGGGIGVPYFSHESAIDVATLAAGVTDLVKRISRHPLLCDARLIIEPGRFLAAPAGLYVATVVDVKTSRGRKYVVLDGGMNHHLAASGNLGQTIKRNFPIGLINRMGEGREKVDLVGALCTPLDTLGRQVELPVVREGDLIGIFMSGAYGSSASPVGFLSHKAPGEVYVDACGKVSLASLKQTVSTTAVGHDRLKRRGRHG